LIGTNFKSFGAPGPAPRTHRREIKEQPKTIQYENKPTRGKGKTEGQAVGYSDASNQLS